jgi:thiamine-monophosphate kinase
MAKTLQDFGERELIRSVLPEYCDGVGDDCAIVSLGESELLMTTDPVPQPAAKLLGNDPDLYWMGWLLVIINASDLAAAGGKPLSFLAAIEAPPDLPIEDFKRFLAGVRDACKAEGLYYAGGNLREAKALAAVGTAVGTCPRGQALRRIGAHPGDLVVSIGHGGIFWRDVLTIRNGGSLPEPTASPLFRPRSQISAMLHLSEARKITAAIDNSDGLIPSLSQLAIANSLDFFLDLDKLSISEASETTGKQIDPARLWLGWGDWNVIATMNPSDFATAQSIVNELGGVIMQIGKVASAGSGRVMLSRNGKTQKAARLESERFAKDSWFTGGIESYLQLLIDTPLP